MEINVGSKCGRVRGMKAFVSGVSFAALLAFSPLVAADEVYSFTNTSHGRGISALNTDTGVVTGFNSLDVYVDGGLAVQGSNVYAFTSNATGRGISVLNTDTGVVTGFNSLDVYVDGGLAVASPVPEPETYAMMLSGLGLLGTLVGFRKLKALAV